MENPFVYGRIVTGDEFFGREKLIKRIQGYIKAGQNMVLFGDRRMGKTSLATEAIRRLALPCLKVDFYEIRTEREMVLRAIRGIEKLEKDFPFFSRWLARGKRVRGRVSQGLDEPSMTPAVSLEGYFKEPVSSITDLLDYVHDFSKDKPLVAFFDEFQGVSNMEDAMGTLAMMRSEIQEHGKIPYIFAGSIRRQMHNIFMDSEQPFYNSAVTIEIGPIDFKELGPHFQQAFEAGGREISLPSLQTLYDLLYGNTGDFQHLCSALWEVSEPGSILGRSVVQEALEMVWETEIYCYASRRKNLTAQQNRVLQTLALTDGKEPYGSHFRDVGGNISQGSIQKAIAKLEEKDIIFQVHDSKDYRFYAPFFKLWLANQVTYSLDIPLEN